MADDVYSYHAGELPLVVSVPHDGRQVPEDIAAGLTPAGRAMPDTDWHVVRLYDFCRELGAGMLVANYSRYVVDLNRPAGDESLYPGRFTTGLCPSVTFDGRPIYAHGGDVPAAEKARRVVRYWQPYHDRLERALRDTERRHGYALLWDAHSIPSRVPSLFDGELPALSIGTNGGVSCPAPIEDAVYDAARSSPYSSVRNARFKGGFITRHYGRADASCHAIQLELTQRCYMDEATLAYDDGRAGVLVQTLGRMLLAYVDAARSLREGR